MKPTWLVFSRTLTCALSTLNVWLSCQRISNWLDESVANVPKFEILYINLHYDKRFDIMKNHQARITKITIYSPDTNLSEAFSKLRNPPLWKYIGMCSIYNIQYDIYHPFVQSSEFLVWSSTCVRILLWPFCFFPVSIVSQQVCIQKTCV